MKRVYTSIILAVAIIALTAPSTKSAGHSFEFGAGVPRGFMDVSVNSSLNFALKTDDHFRWQVILHESFAGKKSGGEWLLVNILATYGLLRYDFNESRSGFMPFIAAGGGGHFLTSHATKGGRSRRDYVLKLVAKTHGFIGVERTHGSNRLLSLKARFTYPSEFLLDAVYLNYGIRF